MLVFQSCKQNIFDKTIYRGEIEAKDNLKIPLILVISENIIEVYNSDEVIVVDEISQQNDSIKIKLPVFEGYLIGKILNDGLNGWYKMMNK